ncbi:MAG TPA: DNA (cytosine-5-)-methyltransferase [Allosphingosinicella sp.]
MIQFGSVCSGIEAASVAWKPMGWKAAWLSEIEPYPSALLAHHYPDVPNLGNMLDVAELVRQRKVKAPDVFTGGTPCQSFSFAGKRGSLGDARGNLSLAFVDIANAIDAIRATDLAPASIVVWENVPGVLSTNDNAFGCFLGALAGSGCALQPAGKRWSDAGVVHGPQRTVAWRVLDAQYFGLAQRRKRVFVVASARTGFCPFSVLFESEGVRRDSAPSREAKENATRRVRHVTEGRSWPAEVTSTLNAHYGDKWGLEDQHALNGAELFVPAICGTLTARGVTSLGAPEVDGGMFIPDVAQAITASMGNSCLGHNKDENVIAFDSRQECISSKNVFGALGSSTPQAQAVAHPVIGVRRLTPIECERLQGFGDKYTAIPWRGKQAELAPDSTRYKSLGNSWPVPVVTWIGWRIHRQLYPLPTLSKLPQLGVPA